jgi:predicted O-linked N-acetylglucosamine transferase (SPINDLY family)
MTFDMKPLSEGLLALPDDRSVTRFFVSQRAMKFDPAFDGLYADIACKAAACHFWFVRDLKIPWASEVVERRIAAAFQAKGLDPEHYVTWVDWIPGDQFRACMEEMDVYLDTPAFSGFTTAWQAVHCGLPVVTIEGEFLRQRLAAGLLRRIGITDTIAHSVDGYVAISVSLANDREKRETLRHRLRTAAREADEDVTVVRALENAMIAGLKQKNGLRPPVEHTIATFGRFPS